MIPGLAALTGASDYRGRLDLYDGMFVESGGGMTATAYVSADRDELVVDVTGAAMAVKTTDIATSRSNMDRILRRARTFAAGTS